MKGNRKNSGSAAIEIERLVNKTKTGRSLEVGLYAKHLETGDVIEINPDRVFPTASVFKVPVMAEVFRQARAGKFSLKDRLSLKNLTRH